MIGFLFILAIIWLIIASYCDIKKREVPNWLSFSLIIFALAYRAFYASIFNDLMFFIYGLLGCVVFVGLAYAFYYSRTFAGGDAKLLMGLGAVLPVSVSIIGNLIIIITFIFLFLLTGSVYGLLYSGVLALTNKNKFVKEFKKQFKLRKSLFLIGLIFAFLSLIFAFYFKDFILLLLPLIIFVFPILFIYSKSVEESCMIVSVPGNMVTVGDWLYKEVKVGGKRIKPYWEGLSEEEVNLIRKSGKKVKIKQGIPFVPAFLVAFILLLVLKNNLLNFIK